MKPLPCFMPILVIAMVTPVLAAPELWQRANAAYDRGEYRQAAGYYNALLEQGLRQPEVYYNLGNAYLKEGKIGLAIASYRRCLEVMPSFDLAKENLAYARGLVVDKVEEKPRGFLGDAWAALLSILSPSGYFLFAVALYWISAALFSLHIIGLLRKQLLIMFSAPVLFLFVLGVCLAYFAITQERNAKWGVLITPSENLKEGPTEDSPKIFTGHEGLEFRILGERQKHYLVELANGLKGWFPSSSIVEI